MKMVDMEDDVFFADLTERISLLITEEEEEEEQHKENYVYGNKEFSRNSPVMVPPTIQTPTSVQPGPFFYEAAVHGRETRGTGVFIPKSSFPNRKNTSARGARSKHNGNKSKESPMIPPNKNKNTSNSSSNNKSHMSSSTCSYSSF